MAILKIDWENNDLNKFKKINEDIKSKKDMVIFVKGKENYIKNINENIEKWTEKSKNVEDYWLLWYGRNITRYG